MAAMKPKRDKKLNQELIRLYLAAGLAALSYTFFKLYRLLSYSEESVLGVSRWGGLLALGLANTLVIALIVFIAVRALAKIYFERRHGILGSRIRTKLVVAFLAVGILPSAMLFTMGRPFVLKNIERWFAPETDRLIRDGGEISRLYKDSLLARLRWEAKSVAKLNHSPQQVLSEFDLDFSSNSSQIAVKNAMSPPVLPRDSEAWAIDVGADGTWYLGRNGDWVIGRLVGRNVQDSLARLERRQEEAQQIKRFSDTLVDFTDNVLLFMTLLTIFAAVWTGLTLSRTIAEPIRALAKAAKRVGMGDLEVALPEEGEDELAFLSRSFNAMTRDLRAGNEEIKRHTQRIDRHRAYLNELLEALPVGVISISPDGRLRTFNKMTQSWLDMEPFDAERNYWGDPAWRSRLGNLPNMLDRVCQTGKSRQEDLRIGSEGKGRPVKAMLVPLTGGGGLAVLEDLSLLAQAEKRAAWQEVARRMAHEVKNPLTPIKLTAQRLVRRVRDGRLEPQAVSEGAETILTEVESLARLVDSFTHFAQLPLPQPTICDACEIIRQIQALYDPDQEKIELELILPDHPILVNWDGDMVKRALINFTDNAIHAIHDRGKITLGISLSGGTVRLSVQDNGSGVPLEVRAHLFEPYFSTKQRGTGIGLAIARKIAEDHGGTAMYEALENGSMFYLELPVTYGDNRSNSA